MKLTNNQMFESLAVLVQAEETGMLGYAIAKNRRKILSEVKEYSEKRDELLKEYGENKGNGQFEFSQENAEKFYNALKPYSNLAVDVDVMQVSEEVFCNGNLTSSQMYTLAWMVAEGEV